MGGCRHEGSCVWVRVVGVLVQGLAQVARRLEGPEGCGGSRIWGGYVSTSTSTRATRLARAPEDQAPPAQVAASDTSPETRDTSATPPAPACPTRAQLPRPPEAGDRPVVAGPYAASARLVQAMGGPGPSPTRPSVGVSSTCLWPAMGGLSPSPCCIAS